MPSFVPRREPIKKEEELLKREQELRHALQKKLQQKNLITIAEKYRKARLSLLKATIHVIKDKEFSRQPHKFKIEFIETQIKPWTDKTNEQIIDEFKQGLTIVLQIESKVEINKHYLNAH